MEADLILKQAFLEEQQQRLEQGEKQRHLHNQILTLQQHKQHEEGRVQVFRTVFYQFMYVAP